MGKKVTFECNIKLLITFFSLELSDGDDDRKDEFIDRRKIDSIGWLLYDKLQRAEAMYQANALTRSFVASGKYEFAKDAW